MPDDADEKSPAQAARILELLWRHTLPAKPGARGPKPGLTVDAVFAFGDGPGAGVLVLPERPARMAEQHLQLAVGRAAVEQ